MSVKISVWLGSVRVLWLYINWLLVSCYMIAVRVCHGKTALCLILLSIPAKTPPAGCSWPRVCLTFGLSELCSQLFEVYHL